jgi:alkylation response protein AidB-like acyl-CoA dehydrogenase
MVDVARTGTSAEQDAGRSLLEAARELAPKIEASGSKIERDQRIPPEILTPMVDAGLFRMTVPQSLGGSELPLLEYSQVVEAIAQADASTAWCISQNSGVAVLSGYVPKEAAREIFGPKTVMAGGQGPATAVKVQGGFRLTGQWAFGSGMRQATWLRAICRLVDETPTALRPTRDGYILFVPVEQVEVRDVWNVSGLRGTGSDTYSVADLFVPDDHSVQEKCQEDGPLYVFGTNQVFSIGFASVALGIARASLEALIDFAANKKPRGVSGLLREQARTQMQVAESEATLRSARAFLHEAVAEAWEHVSRTHTLSMDDRVLLRLATTFTIHRCKDVVDTAYHLAGGNAIFADHPFERRFRDMHAVTQQMQAREDHFEAVGRFLMGLEPDDQWL